jgi:hypothetical protein
MIVLLAQDVGPMLPTTVSRCQRLEHLGAEGLHQLAGEVRANALDHAHPQVSFDALQRGGRHDP